MLFRLCLAMAVTHVSAGCLAADESIIARHLEAIGGAKALKSLKTVIREAECRGENPQGNFSGSVNGRIYKMSVSNHSLCFLASTS